MAAAAALFGCSGLSQAGLEPDQVNQIEQACDGELLTFRPVAGLLESDPAVAEYATCKPVAFCLSRSEGAAATDGPDNLLAFFLMQTNRYAWKVSHPGGHAAARVDGNGALQVLLGGWYPENAHAVGSRYSATYYQQPPGSRLRWAMVHAPPMEQNAKREVVQPWRPAPGGGADQRPLHVNVEVRAAHAPAFGDGADLFDMQGRLKVAGDRPQAIQHLRTGSCRFAVELDHARAALKPPTRAPATAASPAP